MADTEETQFPGLKDDSSGAPPPEPPKPSRIQRVSFAERIAEREPEPRIVAAGKLKGQTRRDFLIYGAGVALAAAGFYWALPEDTQTRLGRKGPGLSPKAAAAKEAWLNRSLNFDDDVAEALYSPSRLVPVYDKSQITPNLRNNYEGQTPAPDYIPGWTLTLAGLASGKAERLHIGKLLAFPSHEQITRLVCVEGWSGIAWWGGLRFADLLAAYPPQPGATWIRLDSEYNLDGDGNSDPYYVSLDMATARHPQTLLATQQNGRPLSVEHGAPLRLVAPMKLGLKNIKAISKITYTAKEPADYWSDMGRGYSRYDGL